MKKIFAILFILLINFISADEIDDLFQAINDENYEKVKILVNQGIDLECRNIDLNTPLMQASRMGDYKIVKLLIDAGADIEADDGLQTALMLAAGNDNLEIVKLLVDAGADINKYIEEEYSTAIFYASMWSHYDVVKYLIEKGAIIEPKKGADSPLLIAIDINIIKLLLDSGANANRKGNDDLTIFDRTYYDKDVLNFLKNYKNSKEKFLNNYVLVEGGSFEMGDTLGGGFEWKEKPIHKVTLNNFYISKYEITQKDFKAIMGYNPSNFIGNNKPVEQVTWYDAVMYANKLSEKEGLTPFYSISNIKKEGNNIVDATVVIIGEKGYRLPTEAEWEYAAKGGNKSKNYKYSGSNNIDKVGWYFNKNENSTFVIGSKTSNELGLYDMSGNVYEWCWNWENTYSSEDLINPVGPANGTKRIMRGGCWSGDVGGTRVSSRHSWEPYLKEYYIGFRLVKSY